MIDQNKTQLFLYKPFLKSLHPSLTRVHTGKRIPLTTGGGRWAGGGEWGLGGSGYAGRQGSPVFLSQGSSSVLMRVLTTSGCLGAMSLSW